MQETTVTEREKNKNVRKMVKDRSIKMKMKKANKGENNTSNIVV